MGPEEVRFQIGGDDLAVGGDHLGKPKRDRAAASADLDTTDARPDPKALKMRPGSFVERVFEPAKPDPLLGPGVVVRVPTAHASPRYRVEISPGRLKR